jgi:hypothetical protein
VTVDGPSVVRDGSGAVGDFAVAVDVVGVVSVGWSAGTNPPQPDRTTSRHRTPRGNDCRRVEGIDIDAVMHVA